MVNENGLVKKLGTDTPYIKSIIKPPITISYPGDTIISASAKSTVKYHGKRKMLKKNKTVKINLRII